MAPLMNHDTMDDTKSSRPEHTATPETQSLKLFSFTPR